MNDLDFSVISHLLYNAFKHSCYARPTSGVRGIRWPLLLLAARAPWDTWHLCLFLLKFHNVLLCGYELLILHEVHRALVRLGITRVLERGLYALCQASRRFYLKCLGIFEYLTGFIPRGNIPAIADYTLSEVVILIACADHCRWKCVNDITDQ